MSDVKPEKKKSSMGCLIPVLVLIAIGVYAAFIGPSFLKPISPLVVLPAEPTGLAIAGFPITNTILATLLADAALIWMALNWRSVTRNGQKIASGFANFFEWIVEFLWNSVNGAAGKWAKRIFIVPATIFLLVFVANMIKMVPGFESIGYMKEGHGSYGYKPVTLIPGVLYSLDKGHPISEAAAHAEGEAAAAEAGHEGATEISPDKYYEVVPFLRGSATDLNFPFALAFIAVLMTQVYGVMALGPGYFEKFFQFRALISGGPFGAINFAVGLLEVILEFAKILSFGFRLFGNIFAGALLLSIVGALTAVAVPAGLYLFEVFFGIIQAYVFFLLSTMFISSATVSITLKSIINNLGCWLRVRLAASTPTITKTTRRRNKMEFNELFVQGMKLLGAGLAMFGAIGAGVGVGLAAAGGVQAMGRNPDAAPMIQTNMILGMAFAEAVAIYALAVALIIIFAA